MFSSPPHPHPALRLGLPTSPFPDPALAAVAHHRQQLAPGTHWKIFYVYCVCKQYFQGSGIYILYLWWVLWKVSVESFTLMTRKSNTCQNFINICECIPSKQQTSSILHQLLFPSAFCESYRSTAVQLLVLFKTFDILK